MQCIVLRVFTRDGGGGNHLGVVERHLPADDMQRLAADLGFSETIFIDRDDDPPVVRIFTPEQELPFAGHPLVGAAWWLGAGVDHLRCGIGLVETAVDDDHASVRVAMTGSAADAAAVADLPRRAGLGEPVRVDRIHLPLDYVLVELPSIGAVAGASPDLVTLGEVHGCLIYHRAGDRVRARFFAPTAGIAEDPATGSAAVALATALAARGEDEGSLVIHQGEEIEAPSEIRLTWAGGVARIGGGVVHDETGDC